MMSITNRSEEMSMSKSAPRKALAGLHAMNERIAEEVPGYREALAEEQILNKRCLALRNDLRLRRDTQGISQKDVASRMKITQSAVSKIENGDGDIGLLTLLRYAVALDLELVFAVTPKSQPFQKAVEVLALMEAKRAGSSMDTWSKADDLLSLHLVGHAPSQEHDQGLSKADQFESKIWGAAFENNLIPSEKMSRTSILLAEQARLMEEASRHFMEATKALAQATTKRIDEIEAEAELP